MRTLKRMMPAIALLGSGAAVAAPPFCVVVSGMAPNCHYFDEASCARAAVAAGGGCVSNARNGTLVSVAPRDAHYCLVSGGTERCYYYDAKSCARAAQDIGGTCITRSR